MQERQGRLQMLCLWVSWFWFVYSKNVSIVFGTLQRVVRQLLQHPQGVKEEGIHEGWPDWQAGVRWTRQEC